MSPSSPAIHIVTQIDVTNTKAFQYLPYEFRREGSLSDGCMSPGQTEE
eukprot:CAMPEP_0184688404 /NCGR_PEP_ID=MMETSP0312-20130426/29780_1 /TAXON_ID=31354 /ORGANISM="Compsopogon coeruleus, Strain SAG 36.94" /LENGTH=47 /DNA_ID= /DNA_START= /DNA_END= /DNA_ORIENTATION=